eukprot:scaffold162068_cov51-Attheya_sp.AAC.1
MADGPGWTMQYLRSFQHGCLVFLWLCSCMCELIDSNQGDMHENSKIRLIFISKDLPMSRVCPCLDIGRICLCQEIDQSLDIGHPRTQKPIVIEVRQQN